MFHLKNLVRSPFNDMRDRVSMGGGRQNRLKNKDIESSLKEVASFIVPCFTGHELYFYLYHKMIFWSAMLYEKADQQAGTCR